MCGDEMKCQYIKPTIAQCQNCTFDDCIRDERQDDNEWHREWIKNHPEQRRAIRSRYWHSHKELERAHKKAYYERLKQDPVRLAEYRKKKAKQKRDREARKRAERKAI